MKGIKDMIKECAGLTLNTFLLRIYDWRFSVFNGDEYEASRKSWTVAKNRFADLKYAVISKIGEDTVRSVYNIEGWEESDEDPEKVMFRGSRNPELEKLWVGKSINPCYKKRGMKGGRFYASSENIVE